MISKFCWIWGSIVVQLYRSALPEQSVVDAGEVEVDARVGSLPMRARCPSMRVKESSLTRVESSSTRAGRDAVDAHAEEAVLGACLVEVCVIDTYLPSLVGLLDEYWVRQPFGTHHLVNHPGLE